jgi:hypothetical protein
LPISAIYNVYSYLQVKNKPHDEVAKTSLYSSIWHSYEQFAFTFNTSQMSIKRRSINQSMKKQETGAKQVESGLYFTEIWPIRAEHCSTNILLGVRAKKQRMPPKGRVEKTL